MSKERIVTEVDPQWIIDLMRKGLIVRITIKKWCGTARLHPDDLGLKFVDEESSDFAKKYLSLGSQKLLPPDILSVFSKLMTRSRKLLDDYSFDTIWGKFVPDTAFAEWEEKNQEIEKDYMEAAKNFGNRYNEIIAIVKEDYKNLAKDVWARLYPESPDGMTKSFEDHFIDSVVSKIPSREEIVSKFEYKCVFSEIPVPSIVAQNISKHNEILREDEKKHQEHQALMNSRQRLAEIYEEKRKEYIESFLDSTVKSLRESIREICDAVLKGIGERKAINKSITGKHTQRIKDIINMSRSLNFYEDDIINEILKELDKETDKLKEDMNTDVIEDRLNKIVEITKEEFVVKDFNPNIAGMDFNRWKS
jgi:hypothetical protein